MIQEQSGTAWEEMYKVFNMGHRMELYVPEGVATELISISENFGIEARVVGRCLPCEQKRLTIVSPSGTFEYL
jgi:phosphoribosylformylglycinamidine cyclo-ligase